MQQWSQLRWLPHWTLFLFLSAFSLSVSSFKFGVNEAIDSTVEDTEAEMEESSNIPKSSYEMWGRYADLAVAFPLVIQNLTNYSALINGKEVRSENITYNFGHLQDDEEFLYDKVSGFFTVLHESMDGQDGPRYCPRRSMKNIKECIVIASCLLQTQVPAYVDMAMYASLVEQMDRFVQTGWGLVERGILKESNFREATPDEQVPEKYQCDAFSHHEPFVSHLQESEDTDSALAMSAVLAQKSEATHRILDAHQQNMSLEGTIRQVMELWRPVCLKAQVFSCDEGNYWDLHYASHRQTMALMQTGNAAALRSEITTRLKLERRVKEFMSQNAEAFGAFLQTSVREGTSSREGNYLDFNRKSKASLETWKEYGRHGKESMFGFVVPYSKAMAAVNTTRVTVLFDQVEFGKFLKKDNLDLEFNEIEEDRTQDSEQVMSVLGEEHEEGSGAVTRTGKGFAKKLKKKIKKKAKKEAKRAVRRVKKAAKAVSKAVKKIEGFISALFGCIGDVFEMITVGYAKDLVPGSVGFGAGLTAGDIVGLSKLLEGKKPTTWMSVDIGFAVGTTAEVAWVGVGAGVGMACSVSKCGAYLAVGTMTTVNIPTISPVCVLGTPMAPGGFICAQVVGASISAFCCNLNVKTGKNDCR